MVLPFINVAVGLRDLVLIYAESIDEHANAVLNADFPKEKKKKKNRQPCTRWSCATFNFIKYARKLDFMLQLKQKVRNFVFLSFCSPPAIFQRAIFYFNKNQ